MTASNFKRRMLVAGGFFLSGVIVWFILNGHKITDVRDRSAPSFDNLQQGTTLVEVAGVPITSDDLEWEYQFHLRGAQGNSEMTPIPDLGPKMEKELGPLKQKLLSGMIERKVLFKYLQQDRKFDFEEPSHYTACLKEWQATLEALPEQFPAKRSQELLKNRLCERAVVMQYLESRIFPAAEPTDNMITEYYKNHLPEFRVPPRATVRQVVLATEDKAREVKRDINQANFADMARKHSITPEGESDGGRVGPFSKGEVPAIFDVAFEMQRGQISAILKSTYGFHIIMLENKQPRRELSLKEATPKIHSILKAKRRDEEYRKWLESALNTVPITSPRS